MLLNEKTLSYLDVGEGPVLLFGHSYLWTSDMWSAQVEALSENYRCLVPELWGHGASIAGASKQAGIDGYGFGRGAGRISSSVFGNDSDGGCGRCLSSSLGGSCPSLLLLRCDSAGGCRLCGCLSTIFIAVAGEQDCSRPPAEAKILSEILPDSTLKLIPDAGHIPSVEQPERVLQNLKDFLGS